MCKLQEYHQSLREVLGLRLGDVPFIIDVKDLAAGGLEKQFHQKRFVRFAKKLPIYPQQDDRYDEEWMRVNEAAVNPAALLTARPHLQLGKHPVDRHFEDNVIFYRRSRQLADPEYAMSTMARQKLRERLCAGGFEAERDFARRKLTGVDLPRDRSIGRIEAVSLTILERIWQGERSLDELKQIHNDLNRPEDMHRLAELMLFADDAEFDLDVKTMDLLFTCDESRAQEFFKDELVKIRRIRQLTFPMRAVHQHPSFRGETPEEEKDEVRRVNMPQWERRGWHLNDAVEKMWAGEVRLRELAAGADAETTYVIRKMQEADESQYEAQARSRHREHNRREMDHRPEAAADL